MAKPMRNGVSGNRTPAWWRGACAVVLVAAFAGCSRDDVKVYRIEKDQSAAQPPASGLPAPAQGDMAAQPQLTWTLPDGWKEVPASGMRVASFAVSGKDGQTADVSVIPLPGGEPELDLVNMWRQQMHLPAVGSAVAEQGMESVGIGSGQGKLFDIASEEPVVDGKSRGRILVAMVTRGPTSWFFKMTGEESFVRDQKPAFVQFLKSISFPAGEEMTQFADAHRFLSTNARETPSANSEKPIWVVPPGWKELPPSQFLVAKFEIPGTGAARAEVNIGAAMGGVTANVNRWRGQLGLPAMDEASLNQLITSVDIDGGKAMLVDMTGTDPKTSQPARMIGAIVPRDGQTWFYKLMGDDMVVGGEKDIFTKFVQSVKYPNAP
jgi:hypothetical protein